MQSCGYRTGVWGLAPILILSGWRKATTHHGGGAEQGGAEQRPDPTRPPTGGTSPRWAMGSLCVQKDTKIIQKSQKPRYSEENQGLTTSLGVGII